MGHTDTSTSALSYGRELAERELAEGPAGPRTLTEDEAYAIVADRVKRETAELTTQVEALTSEKAELQSKLDIAEAAREAAEAAKVAAEEAGTKALEDYKAEQAADKEKAERADSRVAKVREVATHLKDEFFTPERKERWAGMEDEAFDAYIKELAEVSGAPVVEATGGAPRETAMHGTPVKPAEQEATGNLGRLLGFPSKRKEA